MPICHFYYTIHDSIDEGIPFASFNSLHASEIWVPISHQIYAALLCVLEVHQCMTRGTCKVQLGGSLGVSARDAALLPGQGIGRVCAA